VSEPLKRRKKRLHRGGPGQRADCDPPSIEEPAVADVLFVVLIVAVFAVLALVVKGVERLER
jgi:hypothetical protein